MKPGAKTGNDIAGRPSSPATAEGYPSVAKRPWHAPRFVLTEVAQTDTQGGIITDGSAAQSS